VTKRLIDKPADGLQEPPTFFPSARNADIQPQTGAQPGQLPKIDGRGGLKNPAAMPDRKKAGHPVLVTVGTLLIIGRLIPVFI
jgi:hypothetical protein